VFGNNLAYIAQYSSAREDNDVNLQAMQQIVESVEINPPQSWSHVVATSIGISGKRNWRSCRGKAAEQELHDIATAARDKAAFSRCTWH